jgi:hypothetical protein
MAVSSFVLESARPRPRASGRDLADLAQQLLSEFPALRVVKFIESDEEGSSPAKFVVSLDDGSSFRVAANRSTRGMMESIVQRQSDVVVIGTISPLTKLPPTTQ